MQCETKNKPPLNLKITKSEQSKITLTQKKRKKKLISCCANALYLSGGSGATQWKWKKGEKMDNW